MEDEKQPGRKLNHTVYEIHGDYIFKESKHHHVVICCDHQVTGFVEFFLIELKAKNIEVKLHIPEE